MAQHTIETDIEILKGEDDVYHPDVVITFGVSGAKPTHDNIEFHSAEWKYANDQVLHGDLTAEQLDYLQTWFYNRGLNTAYEIAIDSWADCQIAVD